nr:tyrosine aminotransferase [Quercus suber]
MERWNFGANRKLMIAPSGTTVGGVLKKIMENLDKDDPSRPTVPLGHGDPSPFPCFRTAVLAEDAIVDAVRSAKFNSYPPTMVGLLPARRAIADYLSHDLPYTLTPDDVFLTMGCAQAIEVTIRVLTCLGANILLPRPCFPSYGAHASSNNLEVRYFDLIPEKDWEVDIESVEALADENTVAMVIINPGNPCGSVYTHQHLKKIAETARKLGILVVADEVYHHLTFGTNPFVPMGVFGSIVPILTLGSISKRWLVPGWRLGWLVTSDPNGILRKTKGAVPHILEKTGEDFFSKIIDILREAAHICYDRIMEIPCITCPNKPVGSMFVMAKLNPSLLEDIIDDMDFCLKLAKEDSVIVLPVEPSALEDGLGRIKVFCQRHAKKQ